MLSKVAPSARTALVREDEPIEASLQRARLRPTRARVMVLEALRRAPSQPQSRNAIVEHILQRPFAPNFSTVYNTILELERHGFLSKTWTVDGKSRYWLSGTIASSVLMECHCCRRTWPVDDDALLGALQRLSQAQGFALSQAPTRIQVTCSGCGQEAQRQEA